MATLSVRQIMPFLCAFITRRSQFHLHHRSQRTLTEIVSKITQTLDLSFKKGDRHSPGKYRPFALTSGLYKSLEHIIYCHIMSHLQTHNILTNLSHGFRSGFGTETVLITSRNGLLSSFDKGKQQDMAILDFSKAFDTVPHDHLLHKLIIYDAVGSLHSLGNIACQWPWRAPLSFNQDSGVPQGTVAGQLPFLGHISHLPGTVNSQVRLFADGCLMDINDFSDRSTIHVREPD